MRKIFEYDQLEIYLVLVARILLSFFLLGTCIYCLVELKHSFGKEFIPLASFGIIFSLGLMFIAVKDKTLTKVKLHDHSNEIDLEIYSFLSGYEHHTIPVDQFKIEGRKTRSFLSRELISTYEIKLYDNDDMIYSMTNKKFGFDRKGIHTLYKKLSKISN